MLQYQIIFYFAPMLYSFKIWLSALLLFMSIISDAQIGIPTFDRGNFVLKDLLSQAQEVDANVLIVSFSPKAPTDLLAEIKHPDSLLMRHKLVTDVIDPFLEMGDLISFRLKQYSNPGWIFLHHSNRILFYSNQIKTDADLHLAASYAAILKGQYEATASDLEKDKNDRQALRAMIQVISKMYEKRDINRYLNRFMKEMDANNNEDLALLIEVADRSPGFGKLDRLIEDRKDQIIAMTSNHKYMDIRQKAIIANLKQRDLYEPYMIWGRFEKEFGTSADSLYRLQAITFFGQHEGDKESELNEIFDFLNFYPDTPWEVLDPLYARALQLITLKSDLEILLDLISGQVFQGVNHRNLDYRAVILYRLGQKERSLALINEVMALAQKENVVYKSMIYSLNKD